MKRIIEISVFWHNETSNGFGFTITEATANLTSMMSQLTKVYTEMYEDAVQTNSTHQLYNDLTDQLDNLVALKDRFGIEEMILAIGNVWLLEQHNEMVSDDYNGLQIVSLM